MIGGIFKTTIRSNANPDPPFDEPYWLGISVEGNPVLSPRTEPKSVPSAARTTWADSTDDGALTISGNDMSPAASVNLGVATAGPHDKLEVNGILRRDRGNGNGDTLRFV